MRSQQRQCVELSVVRKTAPACGQNGSQAECRMATAMRHRKASQMKVTVIGSGYVGLVTGACLAEMGNHVVSLDLDERKIRMLQGGALPIHEPGLLELVHRNLASGRLVFTTDVALSVAHGTLQFIAVATPPDDDGSADIQQVLAAARNIGRFMTDYKVVIDKSTVPVGTGSKVRTVVEHALRERGLPLDFSVVSNPEFLKEGAAVGDFMRPDRVVIGASDERATLLMRTLYAPFVRNRDRVLVMDVPSAEFTKYAANAMLATRISFMNELSRMAERVGADIEWVRQGIGSDPRIGSQFLYAGIGYGGSCFPKDVKALLRSGGEVGVPLQLLAAVEAVNEEQKQVLVHKIVARLGNDLSGKTFALWGLAFKPNTDDMREAPSRVLVEQLCRRGARVRAYDPVANAQAMQVLGHVAGFETAPSADAALADADALVIATEWREFRTPDFDAIARQLTTPLVFDGRNLYEPATMKSFGIEYHAIGRTQLP
jgi:UDPglucose 6-dehydrogenase